MTLHPVIAETIRALDAVRAHRHEYLALAAEQLSNTVRDRDTRDPTGWPFWQRTASHVHRLCTLATATGDVVPAALADALTRTATAYTAYAISAGLYTQAAAIITHVTAVATTLRPDQVAILTLRHQAARLKDHHGDLAGAEAEYRAVLTDRIRVLGADHPDTLATKDALLVLRDQLR